MILELFSGLFISILAITSFVYLKYMESINEWILVTSKFIYYSGHPLMNDDEIYEQITKRFTKVFSSLAIVIFKTSTFLFLILVLIALSSLSLSILRGNSLLSFNLNNFLSFLFPQYLVKFPFVIGTIIPIFLVPIFYKNKNIKNTYSPFEKFLHYVFLGNKNISKALFNFELWFHKRELKERDKSRNVYISGMARAGTTVLMQYLGQLNEFKSLSYRNLPFLLMPRTGPKLISRKNDNKSERFHKDGIIHSINSYEALEEPFWRNYIGEEYIFDEKIVRHSISNNLYKKYNSFRRLVAGKSIYLAKNNNHLIRAESLHQLDAKNNNITITIIPFRDPYEQAKSLLRQHNLLSKLQSEDEFVLDYMDFLVHHEFGLNTKVTLLNEKDISPFLNRSKNSLEYWLDVWYFFYNQIYHTFKGMESTHFFCYENFKDDPKESLKILFSKLDFVKEDVSTISIKKFKSKIISDTEVKNERYIKLYDKLKLVAIN